MFLHKGDLMFRRADKGKNRFSILDIHTTSPGHEPSVEPEVLTEVRTREVKAELYLRANQFYLRSKRRTFSRSSGIV